MVRTNSSHAQRLAFHIYVVKMHPFLSILNSRSDRSEEETSKGRIKNKLYGSNLETLALYVSTILNPLESPHLNKLYNKRLPQQGTQCQFRLFSFNYLLPIPCTHFHLSCIIYAIPAKHSFGCIRVCYTVYSLAIPVSQSSYFKFKS